MQLASLALARGLYGDSEVLTRQSLDIFRKTLPPAHPYIATGMANLGRSLVELRRFDDALTILTEAIKLETESLGPESEEVAIAGVSLGRALAAKHDFAEAEPLFQKGYRVLVTTRGAQSARTVQVRERVTEFYAQSGQPAKGDAFFRSVSSGETTSVIH
ncbi:MAG: tetratricopeptide repeat protein, partial [Povalibacter sp.]